MRIVPVVALLLVVLASPVRATVFLPADLGELSRDARVIVRGRVVAVDARWTDDRRGIDTIVTLEVESYLKGAFGSMLAFRVPGGDLGRYRSIVVGAPEFAVDDRVVLFLGTTGPSIPYILGLSQGVFRVVRAADNSGLLVTPPGIFPSAAGAVRIVRGDPGRRAMPLAEFEGRVRALAGGGR